ncbi:hypothetical protein [Geitlerinema sp. PCC 9228]|jgi:hypothetical protein|uniref:hypothetical protein n=1 Tax=Geitlerinema sp. PCC 9228 TaxID=111611 RepID=UPI0008F9CDBD|nr:hypothetical protein [Geitlerinema sp. PCC 9228]
MAIISLKAWYIDKYEPIQEIEKRPHDLRLSKQSLLKSALRADFLNDIEEVKQASWFQRYLEGAEVEFYIEGSGGYAISNIDLISHEIYFTKRDVMAHLDPTIFLSYQQEYSASSTALSEALSTALEQLNQRLRFPLKVEVSPRSQKAPTRLNQTTIRRLQKSLLFIADVTPIFEMENELRSQVPSPQVCLELGCALQGKRTEQILLAGQQRYDSLEGHFPFELPNYQQLWFDRTGELEETLPVVLETMLQKFGLFL